MGLGQLWWCFHETVTIVYHCHNPLSLVVVASYQAFEHYSAWSKLRWKPWNKDSCGEKFITGLLTAVVTSFCGPVSFIGLAVPHLSRMMIRTSHHGILMPVTMLTGSVVALFCNLISALPSSAGLIPLNAITPVLGAPVVIFVIMRKMRGID